MPDKTLKRGVRPRARAGGVDAEAELDGHKEDSVLEQAHDDHYRAAKRPR